MDTLSLLYLVHWFDLQVNLWTSCAVSCYTIERDSYQPIVKRKSVFCCQISHMFWLRIKQTQQVLLHKTTRLNTCCVCVCVCVCTRSLYWEPGPHAPPRSPAGPTGPDHVYLLYKRHHVIARPQYNEKQRREHDELDTEFFVAFVWYYSHGRPSNVLVWGHSSADGGSSSAGLISALILLCYLFLQIILWETINNASEQTYTHSNPHTETHMETSN